MLQSLFSAFSRRSGSPKEFASRHGLHEMFIRNWHLGFTSFGGPAVHFQIFHRMFVDKYQWLDEQVYQELFALCQALPGPGSTKMLYAINLIRFGFITGLISFFIWSLPGAAAAYALSRGVERIGDTLPGPVYALLSGLNAATVGIIALAAVQLSQKAITDKITRILVFFGGAAGVLYNALWYFPVLMVVGGCTTVIWDYRWGHKALAPVINLFKKRRPERDVEAERQAENQPDAVELRDASQTGGASSRSAHDSSGLRRVGQNVSRESIHQDADATGTNAAEAAAEMPVTDATDGNNGSGLATISWKIGFALTAIFFAVFITLMVLRGTLKSPPRLFEIFANLFLAGTIIFGGGPVVIPLLREYVVAQGWVSPRDFLLGLAITQAFPGPNFNFAVYLGSLSAATGNSATILGALLAYIGIFAPGLTLHTATMGVWGPLRRRSNKAVFSVLRGVNASAVGLVYTAVYRLWQTGYLTASATTVERRGVSDNGIPLGDEAWLVVITATAFVGGMWFKVPAPAAILLGAVMGLIWYGITLT